MMYFVKHFLSLFFIFSLTPCAWAQSSCVNSDFELNSFTNWTGFTGDCCPIVATSIGIVSGRHTIVTGSGFDPHTCGNVPYLCPWGGGYSCRLGNSASGSQAEKLRYNISVSPSNTLFRYSYAVVLEDAGHLPADQPRFEIKILDASGHLIDPLCGNYLVVASANAPGFQSCGMVRWKNWTQVGLDLSPYIGQNLTIEFSTGDCNLGGHFGYAYIDCSCQSLQNEVLFCQGQDATITAPPNFSYLWTTGDVSQSITITNPVLGQTVSCTLTALNGCHIVLSSVLNHSHIDASFSYVNSCGSPVLFQDSSVALPGAVSTFQWDFGDGSPVDTAQNPLHVFSSSGVYNVTHMVNTSAGCADTVHANVISNSLFSIGSSVHQISCHDLNDGSIMVSPANGIAPYSYLWSPGGATGASISNLHAGSYSVLVTDSVGCGAYLTIQLANPSQIQIDLSMDAIQCAGGTGGIHSSVTGGLAPISYVWSPGGQTTPNISGLQAGTYTLMITDSGLCSSSQSILIPVAPLPLNVVVQTLPVLCFGGNSGSAQAIVTGGVPPYSYNWTPGGQATNGIAALPAGMYLVHVSDSNQCSISVNVEVKEPPLIQLSINQIKETCSGTMDGSISISVTGGTSPFSILWDSTSGNQTAATAINLSAGFHNVTVTDNNLCVASANTELLNNPDPVAHFTNSLLCEGQTADFMDDSYLSAGTITSYSWEFSDGTSSSKPLVTHDMSAAGLVTVKHTAISNFGCTNSITKELEVNPNPNFDFSASDTNGCSPLCIKFFNHSKLSPGNIRKWIWNFDDTGISNEENPSHCFENPGVYSVALTATTLAGCIIQTKPFGIRSFIQPKAEFEWTSDKPLVPEEEITISNLCSACDSVNYIFNSGNKISKVFAAHSNDLIKYRIVESGELSIEQIVKTIHGCVDKTVHTLIVESDFALYIPNTFSPNGDGKNDLFNAVGRGITAYEMVIYDRWGNKIFTSESIDSSWDGNDAASDAYVVTIRARDNRWKWHDYKGTVSLIR